MNQSHALKCVLIGAICALSAGCSAADPDLEAEEVGVAQQRSCSGGPDLIVVNDFNLTGVTGGVQMSFSIKNQGDQSAAYQAYFVQMILENQTTPGCYGATYLPSFGPLAAGDSHTFITSAGGWTVAGMHACGGNWKITADPSNGISECDETNNIGTALNQ
ncbi:MAG: CARDB domain-containing protein [Minicystis sp.]